MKVGTLVTILIHNPQAGLQRRHSFYCVDRVMIKGKNHLEWLDAVLNGEYEL